MEKPLRHAVIVAHPSGRSFTASAAETYRAQVEECGHSVIVRDLYAMRFDPCLGVDEIVFSKDFKPRGDVVAERALIGNCDVFAFFYPLWLNAPPAILKGYLDRVFGFGFAYGDQGRSFVPRLEGRKLISFTSSGAPAEWVRQTGAMDAIHTLFDRYFAQLCGLSLLGHMHFGSITPDASEYFIQARLDELKIAVRGQFAKPETIH